MQGKVIIVTGAARGLGREYAEQLARAGARIVAADIRDAEQTVAAIHESGGDAVACKVDVADSKSTAEMADLAVSVFGKIDGLVNNAAA